MQISMVTFAVQFRRIKPRFRVCLWRSLKAARRFNRLGNGGSCCKTACEVLIPLSVPRAFPSRSSRRDVLNAISLLLPGTLLREGGTTVGHLHSSAAGERRRGRPGEDRITPRQGLKNAGLTAGARETESAVVREGRRLASDISALFPSNFNRALPRGYTLCSGALVILKVGFDGATHAHLYGSHQRWGPAECSAFLKDVREGWLSELGAFMRWQLRGEPEASSRFQTGLLQLTERI